MKTFLEQICGEFKVTINQHVIVGKNPLKTSERIKVLPELNTSRIEYMIDRLNGDTLFSAIALKDAYLRMLVVAASEKYLIIATHNIKHNIVSNALRLVLVLRQLCSKNVMLFPPNTSPLVQPVDHKLLFKVKKGGIGKKTLLRIVLSEVDGSDLVPLIRNINLKHRCYMIEQGWKWISGSTLRASWMR
ncbi:hypothetical protein T4E_11898 [Trichinella pseudospiralis]|uniref:Uncharacterized protein n=1 Tax=Trichinella pseudospiralis TaxID=6337 RepID=A0A0V0Y131_TRIPS|nr:hypothetical protein T4E_11898 [Trichinella pseudospiralis]